MWCCLSDSWPSDPQSVVSRMTGFVITSPELHQCQLPTQEILNWSRPAVQHRSAVVTSQVQSPSSPRPCRPPSTVVDTTSASVCPTAERRGLHPRNVTLWIGSGQLENFCGHPRNSGDDGGDDVNRSTSVPTTTAAILHGCPLPRPTMTPMQNSNTCSPYTRNRVPRADCRWSCAWLRRSTARFRLVGDQARSVIPQTMLCSVRSAAMPA